tara:strand:- start:1812 stop:3005 length:1194 start_codon:yes stop_codon:yes gene_type:complete
MKISYGSNVYGAKEIKEVVKQLKTGTQMGKSVENFENKISKLFRKKKTLLVNSGSSALILSFQSLDFKKGSNFITPVLTFGTLVSSMMMAGYVPNFIDVDSETLCIDEKKIEKKINKKTVGMCIPNLIGNLPNWKILKKIAKKHKLFVIEDSADTLAAKYDKKSTGQYSDISVTSFYGSHIISCAGNGGSISLNQKKLFNRCKLLRSWGRNSSLYKDSESIKNRFNIKLAGIDYDKKFVFSKPGYNLEPSEIGAAFGNIQIKDLNKNINIRKKNFLLHLNFFKKYPKIFNLPKILKHAESAWLAYPILIKENKFFKRKDLMIFLENNNIQTRVIFTGNILKQPGFKKINCIKEKKYPKADYIMKNGILIGCHHGLKNNNIKFIHKKLKFFIENYISN